MTKFYDRASNVVRKIYERRIDAPPVLDAEHDFPNSTKFVASWQKIRDEAIAVRIEKMPRFHDIMPEQADISANDGLDWRMFILKAYGVAVPENVAKMPTLARLLQECPEVKSATVSFLAPRKHIPRHRGPFRGGGVARGAGVGPASDRLRHRHARHRRLQPDPLHPRLAQSPKSE